MLRLIAIFSLVFVSAPAASERHVNEQLEPLRCSYSVAIETSAKRVTPQISTRHCSRAPNLRERLSALAARESQVLRDLGQASYVTGLLQSSKSHLLD